MVFENASFLYQTVKDWAFLLSTLLFILYPVIILAWTTAEGVLAAPRRGDSGETEVKGIHQKSQKLCLPEPVKAAASCCSLPKVRKIGRRRASGVVRCLVPVVVSGVAFAFIKQSLGFASYAWQQPPHQRVPARTSITRDASSSRPSSTPAGASSGGTASATAAAAAALGAAAVLAARRRHGSAASRWEPPRLQAAGGSATMLREMGARDVDELDQDEELPRPTSRLTTSSSMASIASSLSSTSSTGSATVVDGVKRYVAPAPTEVSMWHDVELKVKNLLDEDTGMYRYVNEMPLGCLQKFEVQPHEAGNAILEDPVGSERLAGFGQQVPFNYGCLPQTYRDPNQVDKLYHAPGDDDPLDVIDLGSNTYDVGQVVQCRPLGAVCLIDEGQADWKVLVVDVNDTGPLSKAQNLEDVERLMPGRVAACLKWMDDFKNYGAQLAGEEAEETMLQAEIHGADLAVQLIEQDHKAWKGLVAEVGVDGRSRGHWVGKARTSPPTTGADKEVPHYDAPKPTKVSLWHDVDLSVTDLVGEDQGLVRYVNEMPRGCLQKFEVQPHAPHNQVFEDPVGSKRLKSFGQPVPFNYGCLPQTYRHPERLDALYNAPGDDDPLDLVDLNGSAAPVGKVVQCRPLGAVCLIDEGQADWKILAVNIDEGGPLADAQSIEDVERLAPGRIAECLKWLDDFKQSSAKDAEAQLQLEVHGIEVARRLIKEDHDAWKDLVDSASAEGKARGHWIRSAASKGLREPTPMPQKWLSTLPAEYEVKARGAFALALSGPTSANSGTESAQLPPQTGLEKPLGKDVQARTESGNGGLQCQVPTYEAPPPTSVSLWHDVDLFVKTWLDEPTGYVRYINEMPLGCLQKFEVQPHEVQNAILEDPIGSSRLRDFGQTVPFNYGCLPQTYRDPKRLDDIYDAPGDDDPLDIFDLGSTIVGVGQVARCRPIGAVCLIDEGQADWKILAVNIDDAGPLSKAKTVEDVERIQPGRIAACLKWMDDFKRSNGDDEAVLHAEIHDAECAMKLIRQDHESWRELVSEADEEGRARGHWVASTSAKPKALNVGWIPSCTVAEIEASRKRAVFAGSNQSAQLVPVLAARGRRARTQLEDEKLQ